jgi:hypothetical protein
MNRTFPDTHEEAKDMKSAEETKAFVLEAFDFLFNQRDYATAARF